MHQVHDLLLSKLQVCDFILQCLEETFEFDVLSDEHVDIFDQLLILSLQVVLCYNFFLIIGLGLFLLPLLRLVFLYLLLSWLLLSLDCIICGLLFVLRGLSSFFGVRDLVLGLIIDMLPGSSLTNTIGSIVLGHRQVQIEGHLLGHTSNILEYDRGRLQVRC